MQTRGKIIIVCCMFVMCMLLLLFNADSRQLSFDPGMTFKEFAMANGIKPGRLKAELDMPSVRGKITLREIGMDRQRAGRVASHVRGDIFEKKMAGLHVLFAGAVCLAVFLLWRKAMTTTVKYILLLIAITGFGFALGKTYNPMVALVKTGKGLAGIEGNPVAWLAVLALFCLLAIVGTKAVCGWVCPNGALQDLLFKLPFLGALKTRCKLPFRLTNSIRIALFIVFLAGLVWNLFGLRQQGRAMYHAVNPFNLFEINFASLTVVFYIFATLGLSLLFYRPHCYIVCPFGLLSWVLEKLSIFRIRINRQACTGCGACIKTCPGQAMKGLYEGAVFGADCFSCGECLQACSFDALSYAGRSAEPHSSGNRSGSGIAPAEEKV